MSETKGVSGGMAKTLLKSMSLKLRGLVCFAGARGAKKNPPENPQNEAGRLLKTKGARNFIFRLSTMLLKNNELYMPLHDVDEKKGSY